MKTAKSLCKPTTVSIYTASEDHYSLATFAAQHSATATDMRGSWTFYSAHMLRLLQLHNGGISQPSAAEAAEAKVLRAEEDASRLAASFMMKAAVTKALHEEQASIMQVSSFCFSQNPTLSRHATVQSTFCLMDLGV